MLNFYCHVYQLFNLFSSFIIWRHSIFRCNYFIKNFFDFSKPSGLTLKFGGFSDPEIMKNALQESIDHELKFHSQHVILVKY